MADPFLLQSPRRRPFLRGCLTVTLVLAAFLVLLTVISRMDGNPLAKGDKVAVPNFGTFQVSARPARVGRNPATGAPIQIAASKTVRFKVAKALKDRL